MSIFTLNAANIFNILQGGSPLSILSSVLRSSYEINSDDGSVSLPFDGLYSINPTGSASVVNAPIENGKYQSINKVKEPTRISCVIALSGLTGFTGYIPNIFAGSLISQNSSLKTIKKMIDDTKTYTITTPKEIFESFDLIQWDYSVSAVEGVSLLKVTLTFQEIMQKMEVSLNSSSSATTNTNSMIVPKVPSTNDLINGNKELSKAWEAIENAGNIKLNGGGWGAL